MPAFGGYYANLSDLLPDENLPNPPYQRYWFWSQRLPRISSEEWFNFADYSRCNLAVMLICDFVEDSVDIDWTVHLPLILHIVFLGKSSGPSHE